MGTVTAAMPGRWAVLAYLCSIRELRCRSAECGPGLSQPPARPIPPGIGF